MLLTNYGTQLPEVLGRECYMKPKLRETGIYATGSGVQRLMREASSGAEIKRTRNEEDGLIE